MIEVVDLDDVRMSDPGDGSRFLFEAADELRILR
jgi:hypothetical protein